MSNRDILAKFVEKLSMYELSNFFIFAMVMNDPGQMLTALLQMTISILDDDIRQLFNLVTQKHRKQSVIFKIHREGCLV